MERDLFGAPRVPSWLLRAARIYAVSQRWRFQGLVEGRDLFNCPVPVARFTDRTGSDHDRTPADLAPLIPLTREAA